MLTVLRRFVTDFEWIHDIVGNFGNLCFLVGSVLFLWEDLQTAGVWLFIFGSAGMMVGSLGAALVRWERRIRKNRDIGAEAPV